MVFDTSLRMCYNRVMKDTDTRNPEQEWEFQWMEIHRLAQEAHVQETLGHPGVAKSLRRRMSGHKAAATRIARREGWN